MKKSLLLLTLVCGSVYAEPEVLPPVIDNSSYYGGGAAPNASGGNSANAMYQVLGQIEQLQKEVRQLSGTVEEQAHDLSEFKTRQTKLNKLNEDMEQRIGALEEAKKTAEAAAPVADAASAEAAPPPAPDAAAIPVPVPVVPPPVAAISPPAAPAATPAPVVEAAPTPKPVAKSGAEKAQYQQAYDSLKSGQYAKAIAAFNTFLTDFPQSDVAPNAQYWIGEAYKANHDADASRGAFNKVVANYPNSSKAPDALLKLGYLEVEANNMAKAREYLTRVTSGFPNTKAAQLATQKLGAIGAQ